MQVRLDVLVSAVARDAGLDPDNNSQDKSNIKGWINDSRREVYDSPEMFDALKYEGEFVGVAVVTAGTVSVTNGAAEVTGSGTSFAISQEGQQFSLNGSPWQRIAYVTDATHLTLESGWNATTTAAASYRIWTRDIALPPKVARILALKDPSQPHLDLAFYDNDEFRSRYGIGDTFSDPVAWTQFGSKDFGPDYLGASVFTAVTSTANSPIVDFPAGSNLVGTVLPGSRLILGTNANSTAFMVDRVLSNTKVSLNGYVGTSDATLTATAMANERMLIRTWPAINNTKVYQFEAVKQVNDLISDGDLLELGWYNAILKGAVSKAFGFVRDPREFDKKAEYGGELIKLIRNQYKAFNPSPRLKPYIGRRYGISGTEARDRDTGV